MDSSTFTADQSRASAPPISAAVAQPRVDQPKWLREGLIIVGIWTLCTLVSVFNGAIHNSVSDTQPTDWRRLLTLNVLEWELMVPVTWLLVWLVRRWPIGPGAWQLAPHYAVILTLMGAIKSAIYFPLRQATYPLPHEYTLSGMIIKGLVYQFVELAAVLGVVQAIEYGRSLRQGQLRATQLEARLAQARLEILRSELQPHFLFNALHAISALMHRNVEAADEMITHLGDLLRLSLERKSVQEVPLREELAVLEPYLSIVRIRFGDRLSINVDVDQSLLEFKVPLFLLQPLVENAIRHGIARRAGAGRIEIRARALGDFVQITVFDDGAGLSQNAIREGIGLSNTKMRLEQLYGSAAELVLKGHPESGTEVLVTIPTSRAKAAEQLA